MVQVGRPGTFKEDGVTPKDVDMLVPLNFQVRNTNACSLVFVVTEKVCRPRTLP